LEGFRRSNGCDTMKCSFCGGQVLQGRGKMFVKNDGKVFHFCNSKCEKNWAKKRDARTLKWTKNFEKQA
jgi:large subunit ribosomal protein L24e